MPKCLECGFESGRLQWTHFKYNCTGRFKNGKEYQQAYPGAKVVDPDVAKKCAVTLKKLKEKYGDKEGQARWDEYRRKQSYTNSFEHKLKTKGWTIEEFNNYNKSRSSTLENFVKRYGEEEGLIKWDIYCERQRYTTSIEYFKSKYGDKEGSVKWKEFCENRGNSMDINFISKKYNVDIAGAEQILSERYSNPAFVSNLEKQFVDDILPIVGDNVYTYKTKQFCIWSAELHSPLFYDITSSKKKKIIEFNGNYWHCNPKFYTEDFIISQSGRTAKEVWQRDQLKRKSAEDRGFSVLDIWEDDYVKSPSEVLKKINQWWNNDKN